MEHEFFLRFAPLANPERTEVSGPVPEQDLSRELDYYRRKKGKLWIQCPGPYWLPEEEAQRRWPKLFPVFTSVDPIPNISDAEATREVEIPLQRTTPIHSPNESTDETAPDQSWWAWVIPVLFFICGLIVSYIYRKLRGYT